MNISYKTSPQRAILNVRQSKNFVTNQTLNPKDKPMDNDVYTETKQSRKQIQDARIRAAIYKMVRRHSNKGKITGNQKQMLDKMITKLNTSNFLWEGHYIGFLVGHQGVNPSRRTVFNYLRTLQALNILKKHSKKTPYDQCRYSLILDEECKQEIEHITKIKLDDPCATIAHNTIREDRDTVLLGFATTWAREHNLFNKNKDINIHESWKTNNKNKQRKQSYPYMHSNELTNSSPPSAAPSVAPGGGTEIHGMNVRRNNNPYKSYEDALRNADSCAVGALPRGQRHAHMNRDANWSVNDLPF